MECLKTYYVKKYQVEVPCGKCPACRKRRASAWSFRLLQQKKVSNSAYFITLTYDTSNVPITKNGFMDLSVRDVQLFIKRLRKHEPNGDCRIKYYAVGEYGGRRFRPHYHIILFNVVNHELIGKCWKNGHVHYGDVTDASVGYTLKYITKVGRIPLHKNDDRTREFSLMSKGLGINYLTDAMIKWHCNDIENRVYCHVGEKKISMPRYYKDKLYMPDERERIAAAGLKRIEEKKLDDIRKAGSVERYEHDREQLVKDIFAKAKRDEKKMMLKSKI